MEREWGHHSQEMAPNIIRMWQRGGKMKKQRNEGAHLQNYEKYKRRQKKMEVEREDQLDNM